MKLPPQEPFTAGPESAHPGGCQVHVPNTPHLLAVPSLTVSPDPCQERPHDLFPSPGFYSEQNDLSDGFIREGVTLA